jgi:hypothetical protein
MADTCKWHNVGDFDERQDTKLEASVAIPGVMRPKRETHAPGTHCVPNVPAQGLLYLYLYPCHIESTNRKNGS